MKHFGTQFRDPVLLKLALTHRSYLSVTGQGPRESNERLEFLGDSVLGLVTSEYLYRRHPDEHEGQLTKTKSLLVSKAILSRRALRMGLGRFVLMSHSEIESGGRQRLSILADAFESVLGAIYLDQGFEASRTFIHTHLLADSDEIAADKRHTNYKSHLQEYVQSTYRTHPVYRIRSEYGPDHSKHFMVEVMVGRRTLGEGRGHNKKEAEQAAARNALENVKRLRQDVTEGGPADAPPARADEREGSGEGRGRRRRRGGRGRAGAVAGAGGEPPRAEAGKGLDAGVVEEYEAEEDAIADEQEFDVEVLTPGAGAAAAADDDEDEDDDEADDATDDLDEDDEDDEDDDELDDLPDHEVDESEVVDDLDETANDEIDDEDEDDDDVAPGRKSDPVHEELLVDPFDAGEESPGIDPAEAERERAAAAKRVEDMERAMESFGQRRPEAYGRRGRPARRGR
jgi:ribonuclease-3